MTTKLLQAFGVLFVLGLVGGAVAGFGVLKDRVRIVIAADEAASGPDPVALLRDDVQVLARDVGALQQALSGNLEQLANALEERAVARHGEVMALQKDLADLQRRLAAVGQDAAAGRQQLAQIDARLAAQPVATAAAGGGTVPVGNPGAAPVATEPTPVEPVAAAPSPGEPVGQPVPGKVGDAPKKAGFLSFSLPTSTYRCDEPQDYVLVPELSRVGFDAKSTLHDFTGVTSNVSGQFRADFDDPAGAWTGVVECEAATLKTGVDGRDNNMWEYLDTKTHAAIEFTIQKFVPAAGGVDVTKQTAKGEIAGTMTIRGKTREVRMPVTLEVDAQKRLIVKGEMPLKLSDYEVPVPSQLGVINMQDEVKVWVALRARVTAGGRK